MSGTSLDGIDVALIETDGERIAGFGPFETSGYGPAERDLLRRALRDAVAITDRKARPGVLAEAEAFVTGRHADAVRSFLARETLDAASVDLVGFHGQTVFHDPARRLTVQLGDGQALADRLGLPVVWDLRADDVAAGGQGAPLVPVYHRALAEAAGLAGPVAFLNVGGVANLTYVGREDELIAFDTGPGNALLDDWVFQRTGRPFDADGKLAASGKPAADVLGRLLAHPYFAERPPKSLDRNAFDASLLAHLSDADGAATLLHFSAHAVAAALRHCPKPPGACYVCGGGRRNSEFMRVLRAVLADPPVLPVEALNLDGDAIEAQAFAFLAVRAVHRLPLTFPSTTGVPAPLTGGRVSRPLARG